MAERRMFAKSIVDSDAFMDMPTSSQMLYFHLAMRADDDGFVNNPRKIQRMVGASDDDMRIIASKRFILVFKSGVIVIKHWRIHNYLRSDRYRPTAYIEELSQLTIKENGAYTERNDAVLLLSATPDGIPRGVPVVYQAVDKRLTQDRLGKERIVCDSDPSIPSKETEQAFAVFWQEYPRKVGKKPALKAFAKIAPDGAMMDVILTSLRIQRKSMQWTRNNGEFIPHPATWLAQERWTDELPDLEAFAKEKKEVVLSD